VIGSAGVTNDARVDKRCDHPLDCGGPNITTAGGIGIALNCLLALTAVSRLDGTLDDLGVTTGAMSCV